jgi:hypothetical protein
MQDVCCITTHLGKGDAALSRFIPLACGAYSALSHQHHSNISSFDPSREILNLPAPIDPFRRIRGYRALRNPLADVWPLHHHSTALPAPLPPMTKLIQKHWLAAHSARRSSAIPSNFDFTCCQFGQFVCNSE